jgi:hypothetical protein
LNAKNLYQLNVALKNFGFLPESPCTFKSGGHKDFAFSWLSGQCVRLKTCENEGKKRKTSLGIES